MTVEERLGYLWLADRQTPRSTVPRWDFERGYRFCGAFGMRFRAPLHVVLDNFSEDEHTPFVHTRLGWCDVDAGRIGFHAENHDDHTRVHYDAPQRPTRVGRLFGLQPGDIFHNDWVTRFDPVCTVYETKWCDPVTGEPRPLRITSPIFFVPWDTQTTFLHTFVFAQIGEPFARFFPVLKHVATAVAWGEIRDDARFIPTVAGTPASTVGMRLGRFDKPLVHNHRLLERLYYAADATGAVTSWPSWIVGNTPTSRTAHPPAETIGVSTAARPLQKGPSTMSNRQWLKQLAATETKTWMSAVTPLGLDGTLRLETRHTIYVFRDGVCVDVARRGEDEVSGELTMIGMRVVGWLMEVEGSRRLLPRWIPGARAVLFRPPTDILPTRIALTSTSYRFVLIDCSQSRTQGRR